MGSGEKAELAVRAPAGTPPGAELFLAGPGRSLADWSPHRLHLERGDDGLYRAWLPISAGDSFSITLGDFRRAEANAAGFARAPHAVPADFAGGALAVEVEAWAPDSVRYIPDFASAFGDSRRTITVALPPGYDGETRYPVMYLHDGQNLFDSETSFSGAWNCHDAACRAACAGLARPVILVGVANTPDRLSEYGPRAGRSEVAGDYARMVATELKPRIDAEYCTLSGPEHTAIGGSSMGGLISLYFALWHPNVFGKVAAISPSLWWDRQAFARDFDPSATWLKSCRIWLDMGGQEGSTPDSQLAMLRHARRLSGLLKRAGADARFREYPEAGHGEWDWGHRFPDVLEYLFPA